MEVAAGHRIDQLLRIGISLTVEELLDRNPLDQAAILHDDHAIGDFQHHAKIVRNQENGDAAFFAQRSEHIPKNCFADTSTAESGSSAISSFGCNSKARAITTRWASPPLR